LYAPSDHLAWLFAKHHERLARVFVMYTPGEEAIITLLDKERLHAACAEVGIDVPETYAVGTDGARAIHDRLRWPVLLKPRTQVFLETGIKGFIANGPAELEAALTRFRQLVRYNPMITDYHAEVREPLVQEYLADAETRIFSISGFVSKRGELIARAAM